MALLWINKQYGEKILPEHVNALAKAIKDNEKSIDKIPDVPKKTSDLTNDSGFLTSLDQDLMQVQSFSQINQSNKIYSVFVSDLQIFEPPQPIEGKQNQILIYLKLNDGGSVNWDSNSVVSLSGDFGILESGYYRVIAEYNPTMGKWVIGTLKDGEIE